MALWKHEEGLHQGETVKSVCQDLGHSRATQYRWKDKARGKKTGPKKPEGELGTAMEWEIRSFDRAKDGTWGTHPIYAFFGGVIPRSKINEVLDERRDAEGRVKRPHVKRYEFAAPQVAYSTDFISVRPRGRVLRVLDERSRYILGFGHKDRWPEEEVTPFVENIIVTLGLPLFFKHDLGSEFRSQLFQAMLRSHKVIAVPSPPHYPKFNGKNERGNRTTREWIAETEQNRPTLSAVWEKLTQSTFDQNEARPKDVLGGRTPADVWSKDKRVTVDRDSIYSEWDALRQDVLNRHPPDAGRRDAAEMEAMRLAALVVVKKYKLVQYPVNPEVPKVSG
jgi:transposase InsO family protein